jgi:TatD DNase family protein
MLVDAHCHLTGSHVEKEGLESILGRARNAGIGGFIAVGTDLEDSRAVLEIAKAHPEVRVCAGLHPHEAKAWTPEMETGFRELLKAPEVLFVGETGLDWHYDLSPREAQEAVFRAHIRMARERAKPLVIHTREAGEATLRILEEEGAGQVGGMIHCFSEDLDFAHKAVALGFHLSFSGIVTFKKAEAIQAAATWAPEDRILVETDSPYLAPIPHRGKTNEPAFVSLVAERLAVLRGTTLDRITECTTQNLEALCGWRP